MRVKQIKLFYFHRLKYNSREMQEIINEWLLDNSEIEVDTIDFKVDENMNDRNYALNNVLVIITYFKNIDIESEFKEED